MASAPRKVVLHNRDGSTVAVVELDETVTPDVIVYAAGTFFRRSGGDYVRAIVADVSGS